jgi:hypothetical protein
MKKPERPMAGFRACVATMKRIEEYARSEGVNKSTAILMLVEKGLGVK